MERNKKSPKINELVKKYMSGESIEKLIDDDSLKVFKSRKAFIGVYYCEDDKRKQFSTSEPDESIAKKIFQNFLIEKIKSNSTLGGLKYGYIKVSTLSRDYINFLEKNGRLHSTIAEYKNSFKVLENAFGDFSIGMLTKEHVQNFLYGGIEKHSIRFGQISPATLKKHIRNYHALWSYVIENYHDVLKSNVWENIVNPRDITIKNPLTLVDINKVEIVLPKSL